MEEKKVGKKDKPIRPLSLALVLLITGSAMACTAVLAPSPAPGGLPATSPAPLSTRAVPTDTPTRAPSPTPTPVLRLISSREGFIPPGEWGIVLVWTGPDLTERQRFIVEVAGRELELRGPQPGPEFRYALPFKLPEGYYTWRVRLEEEREGKWEVVARSEEQWFSVPTPLPTPSPTETLPCPTCPPPTLPPTETLPCPTCPAPGWP